MLLDVGLVARDNKRSARFAANGTRASKSARVTGPGRFLVRGVVRRDGVHCLCDIANGCDRAGVC